jgi:hypothetical protein
LRYLGLSDPSILLPPEEIYRKSNFFLQTLDVEVNNIVVNEEVTIRSVALLTKLLCLQFRGLIDVVPDRIEKMTSLEELEINYAGLEEPWMRFVKGLCSLRELRVLRLDTPDPWTNVRVEDSLVLQLLQNLQKLEILSLCMSSSPVGADASAWEAAGFLLSRRLRELSLMWISFSIILHQLLASSSPLPSVLACGCYRREGPENPRQVAPAMFPRPGCALRCRSGMQQQQHQR